jgi:processive 1,2-diacylglycerol beta-glucosyltransferase/1,2-diacylglycerol 3-beta-galactosyltransferase
MEQKIVFLYLNTGGGHVAPARALAQGLEAAYPGECSSFLMHGFAPEMRFTRFFFEDGYRIVSNYFQPGYVLFYQASAMPWILKSGNRFLSVRGLLNLTRFLREKGITKVVCVHEALIDMARKAIDRVNPDIKLITILTDPYTAHPVWFQEKRTELVVFSDKLKREAIEVHGWPQERVHRFQFMLNKAYERRYTEEEKREVKKRLGIPLDKPVILIAGGGEGLSGAEKIVWRFRRRKRSETLLVVCGRNRLLRSNLRTMTEGMGNVKLFGFVSFMPDLLNIADCVITKGGASTVMEVLSVGKPAIFSTFIRGQELGNVLYSVYSGAGWYITKADAILDKAIELLYDEKAMAQVRKNIEALGIRNGLSDVVTFIHDL